MVRPEYFFSPDGKSCDRIRPPSKYSLAVDHGQREKTEVPGGAERSAQQPAGAVDCREAALRRRVQDFLRLCPQYQPRGRVHCHGEPARAWRPVRLAGDVSAAGSVRFAMPLRGGLETSLRTGREVRAGDGTAFSRPAAGEWRRHRALDQSTNRREGALNSSVARKLTEPKSTVTS